MLIAEADFPFLEVLWSMIIFFAWVIYIWVAITVLMDVLRRHDIGGGGKALWVVFVIVLPFVGILAYLVSQHDGMRDRSVKEVKAQQAAFDEYVRERAGGSAKELLDSGAITQAEFDALKAKALS
jgi:hypothetical protein